MKKMTALFLSLLMIFTLTACGSQSSGNDTTDTQSVSDSTETSAEASTEATTEAPEEASAEESETTGGKTLVVYYSATGNTEEAASYIAAAAGADLFELVPVEPYSDDDLDWTDDNSRVVYEHDNPDARVVELVESTVSDWESYDTVFIGYPIWWGIAAWPVDGFIAANDFTGKTVIPFCTSSSSELGDSGELLEEAAGTGSWLEGMRFSSGVSEEEVQSWVESLGL
jgi:flavodoxin